jgi:hypothetical protein
MATHNKPAIARRERLKKVGVCTTYTYKVYAVTKLAKNKAREAIILDFIKLRRRFAPEAHADKKTSGLDRLIQPMC